MRNQLVIFVTVLCVAACLPGVGAAQQAPAGQGKQAQQIVLPVTVRDKHGAIIPNVQKSDLTLTIDGHPAAIQSLTAESNRPFRIGLLMDTSKGMLGALPAERKAGEQLIDDILPASGDSQNQMFLLHFDREVELLRDFTNSREKLHADFDDMGSTHPQQQSENEGPETVDDHRPRPGHNGTQLYDAIYLACNELMQQQHGRKALVVFSNGADHGSKETMNEAVDAADRANVSVYTIFFKGEQENQNRGFERNRRGQLGSPGGGYPGGGYPGGYPSGGEDKRTPEPKSATGLDGKKIMQEIATRTGGHAYEAKRTSDLEPIFKLIDQELRGQYLLTYTPDKPDTDGGFHKVAITTDKKDWSVSTREGFYAPEQ